MIRAEPKLGYMDRTHNQNNHLLFKHGKNGKWMILIIQGAATDSHLELGPLRKWLLSLASS
ncbi:hypothetical protein [Endozoicomonas sp. SCSIO W0465]|uniref:hypothetical protein n=1 Tax=Endozoicomonas sp. SCSIO W0465 TaxID=2918516 RepID=UPI0020752DA9|nr:hypothetical protein [Endozoicomonas sp. SCSIO W0465]USE36121.1 hypothetical protein MJO57_29435 [Endozoicomonas sp. SCSIO W0465]